MIGAFVTVLSLNLTLSLVQDYQVIYKTLTITDATGIKRVWTVAGGDIIASVSRVEASFSSRHDRPAWWYRRRGTPSETIEAYCTRAATRAALMHDGVR